MIKQFSIDNMKIACWINPRDFGSHTQSLIFIHGSGGDHSGWSSQYSKLHKQFNIVAINLPGHGRSQGSGESEVDNYRRWVKKLLDIVQLKNPILVGHSLGAAITLNFALNHPQDLKGIVPVGGGLKMPVNAAILEGLKANPAEFIELICKFSLAKENRARFFELSRERLSKMNIDVLHGNLTACNKLDLTSDIGKIKLPALVICGAEDKMMPPDSSRQIAAGIPGAKLCLIEGAGHMVMLEKPAEFNEALSKFAVSIS
jgi:pimeloyl-ACP methyl ester carboxylesterase